MSGLSAVPRYRRNGRPAASLSRPVGSTAPRIGRGRLPRRIPNRFVGAIRHQSPPVIRQPEYSLRLDSKCFNVADVYTRSVPSVDEGLCRPSCARRDDWGATGHRFHGRKIEAFRMARREPHVAARIYVPYAILRWAQSEGDEIRNGIELLDPETMREGSATPASGSAEQPPWRLRIPSRNRRVQQAHGRHLASRAEKRKSVVFNAVRDDD